MIEKLPVTLFEETPESIIIFLKNLGLAGFQMLCFSLHKAILSNKHLLY